jgi:hypothetical protein
VAAPLCKAWLRGFRDFFGWFLLVILCSFDSCKLARRCCRVSSLHACFSALLWADFSRFASRAAAAIRPNSSFSCLRCCLLSWVWRLCAYAASASFSRCAWSSRACEIFAGEKKIALFSSFTRSSVNKAFRGFFCFFWMRTASLSPSFSDYSSATFTWRSWHRRTTRRPSQPRTSPRVSLISSVTTLRSETENIERDPELADVG